MWKYDAAAIVTNTTASITFSAVGAGLNRIKMYITEAAIIPLSEIIRYFRNCLLPSSTSESICPKFAEKKKKD